jgi:hypothetical protein
MCLESPGPEPLASPAPRWVEEKLVALAKNPKVLHLQREPLLTEVPTPASLKGSQFCF